MKSKAFTYVLVALIALCLICTIAHIIYAIYAYQHCSIIYFIGEELW